MTVGTSTEKFASEFVSIQDSTKQNNTQLGQSRAKQLWMLAIVLSILLSVVAALTAARNRIPWSDEGWFSSASHNLATRGFMGTTILNGSEHLTRIQQKTYWVMPLFLLGQAAWYEIFPSDIVSTRGFTLFCGLFLLLAFYLFLDKLLPASYAPKLAVCLLALSFIYIDNAAFARPDVMCCGLGLAGLACFLRLREQHWRWALFGSNAFVAASLFTHPNGIYHFLGLAVMVLWYDRRRLSVLSLFIAALPYFLAISAWGVYIAEDYQAFADQMRANGTNGRWTPTLNPFLIIRNEIQQRYLVVFGFVTGGFALLKSLALVAYVAAVAACLSIRSLRKLSSTKLLLALLVGYFAFMCVFNQKLSYYLIHIVPFFIALLAVWLTWSWQNLPRFRVPIVLCVIILLAVETGGIFLKARTRSYLVTQVPAVDYIRTHSQPGSRIAGSASMLYQLGFDSRLHDDPFLGLKDQTVPDMVVIDPLYKNLYDSWTAVRPADMVNIRQRLSLYRPAFHNADYDVFVRRTP